MEKIPKVWLYIRREIIHKKRAAHFGTAFVFIYPNIIYIIKNVKNESPAIIPKHLELFVL